MNKPGGNNLIQYLRFIPDASRNTGENDFSDRIPVQHYSHFGRSQDFSDTGFCDNNLLTAESSNMIINFSHSINPFDIRLRQEQIHFALHGGYDADTL